MVLIEVIFAITLEIWGEFHHSFSVVIRNDLNIKLKSVKAFPATFQLILLS